MLVQCRHGGQTAPCPSHLPNRLSSQAGQVTDGLMPPTARKNSRKPALPTVRMPLRQLYSSFHASYLTSLMTGFADPNRFLISGQKRIQLLHHRHKFGDNWPSSESGLFPTACIGLVWGVLNDYSLRNEQNPVKSSLLIIRVAKSRRRRYLSQTSIQL